MEIIIARDVKKIVNCLENGGVVVCPTDTVYGLICDASNFKAVEKIFEIKQRERTNPLPVFVSDMAMAKKLAIINDNQEKFLQKSWPGATTVVLRAKKSASWRIAPLLYKDNTIALRIADYKLIQKIFKEFKKPLAQTSANLSGQPATTQFKNVLEYFENAEIQPDLIINAGDLPKNQPSKVIDFSNGAMKILRQ